ncbi:MAG: ABC transporter ATP-binding protein [Bulleidia sp.]
MPADNGKKKEKPKNTKSAIVRLVRYTSSFGMIIFVCVLFAMLSNIGNLLGPKFAGKAIEAVEAGAGHVDMNVVIHYVILMLIVYIIGNILNFIVNISMIRVSRKIGYQMRQDIFEKLMKLPVRYFDQNQAGDIISRVSYDIDVVITCLATDVVQIMTSIVTVAGSFFMMCAISPQLVLCMLITIPAAILFTRTMGKITRPRYARRSAAYGAMNGYVEEMFSGQKSILAYAYENGVSDRFDAINMEAADAYYKSDGLGMMTGPTVGLINNIGLALIGLWGSILYFNGSVGLGSISSFVLYSRKFSGPINEIANIVNEIYSALAASERIFRLLDEEEETADVENAKQLDQVRGDVHMEHVSFGYLKDRIVLHNLNLKADAGKTIAIVGPTGAGKTTIINLLMRFYDVNDGHIYVDDNEIRDLKRDSLRRSYAMVLQDTWLFEGTIFDNIAYGKHNATKEEVIAAAKAAHIHGFIMQLPDGYDTVISEDGGNISKGQKQLLTIARAMLYDTNMLILDEATSNVDTNTEKEVQKAMRNLMKDKTCFVIAHRLSTIQNADQILVLEHGDVIEQGTHESLMKAKNHYYRLYASQFE